MKNKTNWVKVFYLTFAEIFLIIAAVNFSLLLNLRFTDRTLNLILATFFVLIAVGLRIATERMKD